MAKDVWDVERQRAVEAFITDENIRKARLYDPDTIMGGQPYASAFGYTLSIMGKTVDVLTIFPPDMNSDRYVNKKYMVISPDPNDDELAKEAIDAFNGWKGDIENNFVYATGKEFRMFTYHELKAKFGND